MNETHRVETYRDLQVWQCAMDLAEQTYRVTRALPNDERFGLTSQIRRAVSSVPANIAEGHGLRHTREFLRHISIARGSLLEVESHLLLCQRIGFLDEPAIVPLLALSDRISRMLARLRQSLERRLD